MDWKEIYKQKQNGTYTPTATTTPSTTGTTVPPAGGGDWRSIYEQKQNAKGTDVNSWTSAVNTLISDYNTSSSMWEEEGEGFSSYLSERERLLSYADNFRSQYSGNQEALKYIDEVVGVLDSLPVKLLKTWDDVWRDKYQGKSYNDINVLLRDMEDGREKDWLTQYANSPEVMTVKDYENALSIAENQLQWYQEHNKPTVDTVVYGKEITALKGEIERLRAGLWDRESMEKYGNLEDNADFDRVSSAVPTERTAGFGLGFGSSGNFWWLGKGDPVYDYINDIDGAREESVDRRMSGANNPFYIYDNMTEDEISSYNYIYHTQGEKEAKEYLEYLKYELDERQNEKAAENADWLANEHPWAASAISVPVNLMSGVGLIDVAGQNIARSISGEYKPINYNTGAMGASTVSSTIRGTVAQNIVDSTGVIEIDSEEHPILSRVLNGKSWADVYQLGMSMADSATIAAISPVFGKAGTLLLGGAAGTQGMLDALERGANDEQALFMGLLNGTFEALFEKFSLDNLLGANGRNFITTMLKQGFIEGTEELNTSFANNVADILIMAENSNYRKNIAAYMEAGLGKGISEEEATKRALWDAAIEMGWDFIGGMASGGIMGGGSHVIGSVQARNEQLVNTYGSSAAELAQEGLELNPDNRFAQRMLNRAEGGKDLSAGQISRLLKQNEKAINANDLAAIESAAESRLSELGETENVQELARVLAKQAAGKNLSRAESQLLSTSRYGARVSNELNPENIRSGEFSSSWAENIGTDRINAEEYNRIVQEAQIQEEAEESTPGVLYNRTAQEPPVVVAENARTTEAAQTTSQPAEPEAVQTISAEVEQPAGDITAQEGVSPAEAEQIKEEEGTVRDAEAARALVKDMGQAGADLLEYAKGGIAARYLSESEIEAAYQEGQKASTIAAQAKALSVKNAANGKTGRAKGVVRGDGVTIKDLDSFAEKNFNTPQRRAYKILSAYAEATGINIVLYNSASEQASDEQRDNFGKFDPSDSTIHIDINAGIKDVFGYKSLSKFTMLRTFSHEFVHFIEKYNAEEYNEFRAFIFNKLAERGESAADLIDSKIKASGGKMSYNAASREVVAEAMTDILPDSNLMQELAENHKNIFEKLLEKLKEYLAELKDYFNGLSNNSSREANALKEEIDGSIRYLEDIVEMYDRIAKQAVENYQATIATEEAVQETKAEAKTETRAEVKAEPKTSTSENGYTITDNSEFNSVEIKFDGKPSEAIRDVLKANKFRWHKAKAVWYGKSSHEAIMEALDKAYEAERAEATVQAEETEATGKESSQVEEAPQAKPNPIVENTVKAAERAADPNDPYARLEGVMNSLPRFYRDGFLFRIHKAGKGNAFWMAEITAATQRDGYEVANARGLKYQSELFENRAEALEDLIAVARNNKLLENENLNTEKEVRANGENADNNGTVREPDSDRQGDPQILEGAQAADVQGDVPGGDALGNSEERGRETVRNGLRDDAAGHEGARGDGSNQSGDIRRADELSREEAESKAEELHEAVAEQIEQQSTEQPKGRNFVIDDSLNLPSGAKSRFRANVDAIKLIKQLDTEGRHATAAEQAILSKYVGWGGLSEAFGEMTWNRETRKQEMTAKSGWEKEFSELRQLVSEGIITEEEYQAASKSTQNAHYTSVEVIKAMYNGLEQLGFKGGRMLEPSSGVGNFVGAMPASMSSQVQSWTMVELDRITGQIAKYLYPNSDVRIQGFEKANIPDNFMDVAIGNVPFGNYGIVDKAYPKRITKAIHNYFFAKSLDKVRPGGIVMFITSSFTMNGTDTSVRQYIMDRADLLGAIRLPNNAFAGNAGTQVVTDILILKKRAAGTAYSGEAFLEAPYTNVGGGYQSANINEYFNNHPEMVLGTPVFARGMYGANSLTYEPLSDKGSLGEQIQDAFKYIKGRMDYQTKPSPEKTNFAVERAGKKGKNGGYVVHSDGSIARNEGGSIVPVKTDAKTAKRIAGLIGIRDSYRKLANYLQQNVEAKYIKQARKELNAAYDSFVKEHGYINSPANRKAIADDPDCFAIYALENYDAEKKAGTKADIFTKDTISPNRTITHVEDIQSGIIVSINQTGGIDPALIAKLTGKTADAVTRELVEGRLAFKTRDGSLEAPERYLSGNVRAKLREAAALAPIDKDFENNVEELKKIIPADIPYHDIYVTPGAPWVPTSIYADFIAEMLGGYNNESSYRGPDVVVGKSNQGDFKIVVNNARLKANYLNTQKWGTKRRSFLELIEAMMASRSITVNDTIEDVSGKKKSVVNKVETAAAQEKAEEITKEFQDWLWRDESRRNELATLYNEVFNALVTPKYDGSNLTVNGQNPQFSLRPHQADAVQRIISSGGNTLLAHKVGAGKTLEMAAAAMKLRELGIVKKPLFVVPKSLVAQWGVEFMNYYPAAKLLVSDEKSFTKANRMTYANRIATGDYDAVIVSYEQFEKIPMSIEFQQQFYQEQVDEILAAIAEERAETKGKGLTVKEMEKKKAQLEKKIAELTTKAKDEDNINFEQLGIDSIFVDEAHNFKNLQYVSRMNNISGLSNKDGSQRAFDLYTKVRYLQQLNGGRGIVFATATPVMNSMAEMYIMQKYLQSDMLEQLGLKSFDAWAKQFGEVVNSVEIKPSGQGFRVKQTFSNFKNLNELQLLFRSFSDVLTKVPGLKVPKMKGGGVRVEVCEPGQFQKEYMQELEKRADNVKNVDPSEDNMLKITSDGRKVAYTQRMIDPTLPYEPGCKIYRCCENVLAEYKDSKKIKGTQIIFCDMATPKGKSKAANTTENTDEAEFDVESAKLYDDMRAYLVQKGIPAKEIAFIHEADTDAKKKALFADVNEGKVRVLIGSTGKMGVGMNAQKRIVAIHHLDAPWRPGDVEQRDGRAFRQGNINDEVTKYTYVTEGSFDARLWDILDRKQHFINQIMNGEDVGRTAEDTGDVTLSAAEVKALASGNPLIEEHVKLQKDLEKLENLQQAHKANITRARTKLQEDEKNIAMLSARTANLKEDIKARKDTYSEGKFNITIGSQKYTDKKDAGVALIAEIKAKANEENYTAVGSFAGFELRVIKQGHEYSGLLFGKQGYSFNVYVGNTTYGINHLVALAEGLEERLKGNEQRLKDISADRDAQQQILTEPFAKQAELEQKRARFNEIMDILNPKEEQVISEEETAQYQARGYWTPKLSQAEWGLVNRKMDIEIRNNLNYLDEATKWLYAKEKGVEVFAIYGIGDGTVPTLLYVSGGSKASAETLKLSAYLRRINNGAHESRRTFTGWLDAISSAKREYYADYDVNGHRRKALGLDNILSKHSESIRNRNNGGSTEDSSQFQPRIEPLTDREVLAMAASEVEAQINDLSDGERDALRIFNERLVKWEELQSKRAELGKQYRELQFGHNVDREAAKATLERMKLMDEQLQRAEAAVLSVEDKAVLKRVLKKARKVVEQQEHERSKEEIARWRDRRNNAEAIKKYRNRIRADVDELSNWILHPNNKNVVKHVPDALKSSVIPFLSSINFMSKRQLAGGNPTVADEAFMKQLNSVKAALKQNIDVNGLYSGYNDLPPDFMESLQRFIDTAQEITKKSSGEFVINRMTSEELQELSKLVRTLKKYIMQVNRFHANAMYQHVYEAGDGSIEFMGEFNNAGNTGVVSNFVLWQQMRPAYAFERFGKGGMAIYDGLRRGQATLAFNTKKITEFAEAAYTAEEVKAWEKEIKTFNLGGDTVKIPVSGIMSLYELSKRPQALGHVLGEGIRVATYKDGKTKISDTGHRLTPGEMNEIINSLSQRQKDVADQLQQFMAKQGGEWGNYVSVKRWGEELFGEEHYFPINSDGRHLQATADEHPSAASLYALLNMSFTKELQEGANNRIILYSIFDVFSNHMASMAQYNAFALPVLDALKWFNYQQTSEPDEFGNRAVLGSVREQMDRVYGVPEETRPGSGRQGYAQSFVINIIKAFNGTEAQGVPMDELGMNALRKYNMAQVAYNFRVVVQQPLAITRAALLVDYSSIIKGMRLSPAEIRKNISEMQEHSGIAAWKALGFYDINISRGLTSIIKHDTDWRDTVSEIGMKGAETMDTLTWAGIWSACKEQVRKTQKLKPGDEGFFEAVTTLFEDVVYKTQVVDSVLTKNEYLRSKGFFTRATASFMSEPTTTASMLMSAFDKFRMDMQRGMTRQQAWKNNSKYIVRVAYVYGIGAAVLAAVQAVADAFRDDDDYQNFWEKWLEALGGNFADEILPFNKLPIVSDFYDLAKQLLSVVGVDTYGNPPQSVFMQWYDSLVKGVEILYDKISGEDSNYTWYGGVYKLLQAASGITGLPMAAATREIITAWNSTVGALAPSLKVKSYEPSEMAQIRYAFEDGWLTEEEATEQLISQGLVDNEDEAYWTIRGWEAGDGYSRYDAVYDAVRNGGDFSGAMRELTSHGYSEKDVISKVRSQIGTWYRDGEISKSQATSMLTRYADMDSEDITALVNKWSAKVVTGIAYDDIKQAFLDGDITASRAIEMYVRYGGYTHEEATKKVYPWRSEKEMGIPYDELYDAYEDGKLSATELVNAYVVYGQKDSYIELQNTYSTYAQPTGLSTEQFYSTYFVLYEIEGERDAEGNIIGGNGTQELRWAYINSLPLTAAQKDAFHLAFYKQSTLKNTPWH